MGCRIYPHRCARTTAAMNAARPQHTCRICQHRSAPELPPRSTPPANHEYYLIIIGGAPGRITINAQSGSIRWSVYVYMCTLQFLGRMHSYLECICIYFSLQGSMCTYYSIILTNTCCFDKMVRSCILYILWTV